MEINKTPQISPLIRLPQLLQLTGLKRSSVYVLMKSDDFPKQVKLSERSVAWRLSEIEDWINSRQKAA